MCEIGSNMETPSLSRNTVNAMPREKNETLSGEWKIETSSVAFLVAEQ